MTVLAVVPARWASSRFPGKPLALIRGRPMIDHVYRRVQQAQLVDRVLVATDDDRIRDACAERGLEVMMTSPHHASGTDRVAEIAERLPAEIYVNVQGDEPLIEPSAIDAVTRALREGRPRGIEVSTAYIAGGVHEQNENLSAVFLQPTIDGCVLCLSRLSIPSAMSERPTRNLHVGLYAFTPQALARFSSRSRGPTERAESIELMRFLEYGDRIACVPVAPGSIGVDHESDIRRVEQALGGACI